MNAIYYVAILGGCLLGQASYAQAIKQPDRSTKGVLYRCTMPGGRIEFTNKPNPGCVVISLYQVPQWRQLSVGGSGDNTWQLLIDKNWKAENRGAQGWVMWIFANSQTLKLSGEHYKVIREHVSVDCHRSLIITNKRSFYADKAADKPLAPQEINEREGVVPGSPGAIVFQEFCS